MDSVIHSQTRISSLEVCRAADPGDLGIPHTGRSSCIFEHIRRRN